MQDLGFDVLLKGSNMQRLLIGLWTSLRISLIAVVISIFLGLIVGVLMTRKNIILKVFTRVYLESILRQKKHLLLYLVFGEQRKWRILYAVH